MDLSLLLHEPVKYIYVPDLAQERFESLCNDWVEERSEQLGELPLFYEELIYDDTFCQRFLFDLLSEIEEYKLFASPCDTFPLNLDPDFLANDAIQQELNNALGEHQELYQMDMMMYLNSKHICYGMGRKRSVLEPPQLLVIFNQPFPEVW